MSRRLILVVWDSGGDRQKILSEVAERVKLRRVRGEALGAELGFPVRAARRQQ